MSICSPKWSPTGTSVKYEDVYDVLRAAPIERVHDKETNIHVQAAVALSKLYDSEDPSDVEDDREQTAIDVLFDTLSRDPAAEVRRALATPTPCVASSIPILEKNCSTADGSAMGELIIRNGLGDREPAPEEGGAVMDDLIAFLGLFDLNENTVAEDALLSIFTTRIDIFDQFEFKDAFWDTLTPEKAYLARVCVEHYYIATNDQVKLEVSLPVVTHLAHHIQSVYNKYQEGIDSVVQEWALRALDANERDVNKRLDDLLLDAGFVIAEIFKLAVNLDYADEIGRRKMFQLVWDMIGQKGLVARCLDVLRVLSPSERDLIRVVVEVVHELRDEGQEGEGEKEGEDDPSPSAVMVTEPKAPKPPKELTPEEQARADALDMRCLSLCIGMLERINSTFEESSTLEGILGELIVPAVKRKELALREKGLVCLGLCCLIARRVALNSFQLSLSQVQSSPEVLKTRVLHIVFDTLMVHEGDFFGASASLSFYCTCSTLLCVGLAKLVLAGMISDERVLKSLVVAYLSPDTAENQALRRCLAYFFPVYCYSSSVNQNRMRHILVPIFEQLAEATRGLDDDQEMVSPAQIIGMFVDWTDPQKAIEVQGQTIDDGMHLDLA
ncbi:hypothetical protein OG21DRAFT_1487659 [Imleria badia]|nr:hypothetical protein OG21DRAFT_1487659 [Imleria badia]